MCFTILYVSASNLIYLDYYILVKKEKKTFNFSMRARLILCFVKVGHLHSTFICSFIYSSSSSSVCLFVCFNSLIFSFRFVVVVVS